MKDIIGDFVDLLAMYIDFTKREQAALYLRLQGLSFDQMATLIGVAEFGKPITRERARQIEFKARKKLAVYLERRTNETQDNNCST